MQQLDYTQYVQRRDNNSTAFNATSSNNQSQANVQSLALELSAPLRCLSGEHDQCPLPSMKLLFAAYMDLNEMLQTCAMLHRRYFLQTAANCQLYHSMLVAKIDRLDRVGRMVWVNGMSLDQLLSKIRECEQQAPKWDYLSLCCGTLFKGNLEWLYPGSRLFIVIPSNLDSWDDLDPSTHQFRLYFLCDVWMSQNRGISRNGMPLHIHLSDHHGYAINRSKEFFRLYGDYVLRVLRMVEHGYSNIKYTVPALASFKILWNYTCQVGGRPSKHNIGPLVKKAICYLEELSPPKWPNLGLTCSQSAAIKTYLDIQDGDNAEGNLQRFLDIYKSVHWICQTHSLEHSDQKALAKLKKFVRGHGGHIDMQQATLSVELRSVTEAHHFSTLLVSTKHTLNICIKLKFKATQSNILELCQQIAETGAAVLEVEGVNLDILPQDHTQRLSNPFANIGREGESELQLIRLLNYPRYQEQCILTGRCSFQCELSRVRSEHMWVDLNMDLDRFGRVVSLARTVSRCKTAAQELLSSLARYGLSPINIVTVHSSKWQGVFDLLKGIFIDVRSADMQFPESVLSSGSIRTLTQQLSDVEQDEVLYGFVRSDIDLRELNISTEGRNVINQIEPIVRLWANSPNPLRLTLLDRTRDTSGRIVAQAVIGGDARSHHNCDPFEAHDTTSQQLFTQDYTWKEFEEPRILEWDCQLSDYSASFLNVTTQQHPSILNMFVLDMSKLSCDGLACIKNLLRRVCLQYLHVFCTAFDPSLSDPIAQVLASINWTMLRSLVLHGDSIDKWIQLWLLNATPWLMCLAIRGTGSEPQTLSHSSTLFMHHLIYTSPLAELYLDNVQLQYKCDWMCIVEGLDPSVLEMLSLCNHSASQLISAADALELFISNSEMAKMVGSKVTLAMAPFTLGITSLPGQGLARLQKWVSQHKE